MLVCSTRTLAALALAAVAVSGLTPASRAQERDHVVATQELRKAAGQAAESRVTNEAAVRNLLHSEHGQQALKSAGVGYQKVDKAIGQLSDAELASVAERSRQVEKDFAAGTLSDRDLIIIILAVAALVLIIVAVR